MTISDLLSAGDSCIVVAEAEADLPVGRLLR